MWSVFVNAHIYLKRISKPLSLGTGVSMCTFDSGTQILHILAHVCFLVCLLTYQLLREKSSDLPLGFVALSVVSWKALFLGR